MRALLKRALLALGLASVSMAAPAAVDPAARGLALQARAAVLPPAASAQIIANAASTGDSLTAGSEDGTGVTYPDLLSAAIGVPVLNLGIGGQTSTQIGLRVGALPMTLTVSGNSLTSNNYTSVTAINGSAIVSMASNSAAGQPLSTSADIATRFLPGTLCGVPVQLRRKASGGPPSTTETYDVVPQPLLVTNLSCAAGSTFVPINDYATRPEIIQWGRNDFTSPMSVKAAVTAETARHTAAGNSWYLCGSILPGNYSTEYTGGSARAGLDQLNSDLQGICGASHWVDLLAALQAGSSGSTQDNTDVLTNNITPTSQRFDNIHPTASGYALVEAAYYAKRAALMPTTAQQTLSQLNVYDLGRALRFLKGPLYIGCAQPFISGNAIYVPRLYVCGGTSTSGGSGAIWLQNGSAILAQATGDSDVAQILRASGTTPTIILGGSGISGLQIGTGWNNYGSSTQAGASGSAFVNVGNKGSLWFAGPAPTISGSSTLDSYANPMTGTITFAGSPTSVTLTWPTSGPYFQTELHCRVTSEAALPIAYSYSTSSMTITYASGLTGKADYQCDGY